MIMSRRDNTWLTVGFNLRNAQNKPSPKSCNDDTLLFQSIVPAGLWGVDEVFLVRSLLFSLVLCNPEWRISYIPLVCFCKRITCELIFVFQCCFGQFGNRIDFWDTYAAYFHEMNLCQFRLYKFPGKPLTFLLHLIYIWIPHDAFSIFIISEIHGCSRLWFPPTIQIHYLYIIFSIFLIQRIITL